MAASQDYIDKALLRRSYRNVWHTDLTKAIQADFPCVYHILPTCEVPRPLCRSWAVLLSVPVVVSGHCSGSLDPRYVCCAGYMPCSGRCGESKCPELCLATEAFLCFGSSVASTRFLLQDEFNIQTTQCDNCIISFMFCLQQLACICSLVACIVGNQELSEASQAISCVSDAVYWTVCSCMQTQHKVEMDKRDGKLGGAAMTVPPMQQMSRIDQPMPPQVGYAPQPASYR
ncbi:hypothetical protein D1007_60281 [Hordeum vulgare]|nr:hypothetical protein D1007_60281 [Hordeum vulgare]